MLGQTIGARSDTDTRALWAPDYGELDETKTPTNYWAPLPPAPMPRSSGRLSRQAGRMPPATLEETTSSLRSPWPAVRPGAFLAGPSGSYVDLWKGLAACPTPVLFREIRLQDFPVMLYQGIPLENAETTFVHPTEVSDIERVAALVSILRRAEDDASVEPVMAELQRLLREGDTVAAAYLYCLVGDESVAVSVRAILLETMAGARAASFDALVVMAVREALRSTNEQMRFAAIAAASDLPPTRRAGLVDEVQRLAHSAPSGSDVRRAATVLLDSL